jgi:hypothetical protein
MSDKGKSLPGFGFLLVTRHFSIAKLALAGRMTILPF